jgi:hypothetical protein
MAGHTFRLLVSAVLAALIKGGVALFGHSIAWIWAIVIALVIVYGGFLLIEGDIIQ